VSLGSERSQEYSSITAESTCKLEAAGDDCREITVILLRRDNKKYCISNGVWHWWNLRFYQSRDSVFVLECPVEGVTARLQTPGRTVTQVSSGLHIPNTQVRRRPISLRFSPQQDSKQRRSVAIKA
jgi:hypothetical protein